MRNGNTSQKMTDARLAANRRNAAKSTGPRTSEGKAASSRNALKHGLCAEQNLLPGEDREEFLALLKDHYDRFLPVGLAEEKLVLRIASAQWRLDRAAPLETAIYRNRFFELAAEDADEQREYEQKKAWAAADAHPEPPVPVRYPEEGRLARAFDADCLSPNAFAKLARYESTLEHSIDRCLRQLQAFQSARIAAEASAPEPLPEEVIEDERPDDETNPTGQGSEDPVVTPRFEFYGTNPSPSVNPSYNGPGDGDAGGPAGQSPRPSDS